MAPPTTADEFARGDLLSTEADSLQFLLGRHIVVRDARVVVNPSALETEPVSHGMELVQSLGGEVVRRHVVPVPSVPAIGRPVIDEYHFRLSSAMPPGWPRKSPSFEPRFPASMV